MLDTELDLGSESSPESKNSLRLWLNLYKCTKRLEQEMSDRFRENYSSTFPRFDVLAHLYQAGEQGMSTSLLGSSLMASKGNISRLLDRMEEDGLLERKLSEKDRRVSIVYMTENGSRLFKNMAAHHEAWTLEIFQDISAAEKEDLLALLKRIRNTFG
ncbi:MAG: MarR family transcriptional regulator [Gammaproteobacteria bacterium]|nr:MarR family transcriptional regulator [Gammaproteobacteria bacterium]